MFRRRKVEKRRSGSDIERKRFGFDLVEQKIKISRYLFWRRCWDKEAAMEKGKRGGSQVKAGRLGGERD